MNDAQNVRGRAQGMSVQELMDAIEPLLNSLAMEIGHDSGCRMNSGWPDIVAKGCNCSRMEAQEALHALRELGRRLRVSNQDRSPASEPLDDPDLEYDPTTGWRRDDPNQDSDPARERES